MATATRFNYIMSRLGVRSSDLVEQTGLDKTLVSRWKNGHRKLSATSEHTRQIADYLIAQPGSSQIIGRTLQSYGLSEEMGTLRDNLVFWLSEQELLEPPFTPLKNEAAQLEYKASFNIFLGYGGAETGLETMAEYATTLPPGDEWLLVSRSDFASRFYSVFYNGLFKHVPRLSKHGIRLTVLYPADSGIERFGDYYFALMLAVLKGYVKLASYSPAAVPECDDIALAAIKDAVCLHIRRDSAVQDELYTSVYTDAATVRQVYETCRSYLNAAAPAYRAAFFENPETALVSIDRSSLVGAPQYVVCDAPGFGTMDHELISRYISGNRESARQKLKLVEPLFLTPPNYTAEANVRHVFCLETIEELLAVTRRRAPVFTKVFGCEAFFTESKIKRQLRLIGDWLRALPNYEVALLPRRIFGELLFNTSVSRGNYAVVWLSDGSNALSLGSRAEVDALFENTERLWREIPDELKDRDKTLNTIDELIQKSRSGAEE